MSPGRTSNGSSVANSIETGKGRGSGTGFSVKAIYDYTAADKDEVGRCLVLMFIPHKRSRVQFLGGELVLPIESDFWWWKSKLYSSPIEEWPSHKQVNGCL